jgi:hypothetical protein
VQRLKLQSAYISNKENGEREAIAVLRNEERQFVGRIPLSSDYNELMAITLATLDSIRQFLPAPVEFLLKNAAKMQPDPLVKDLFIVKIEMTYAGKIYSLTGACLGHEEEAASNIAKATLDATNQLIEYVIEQSNS